MPFGALPTDLTTLANVKAWLSIQGSTDDQILYRLINSLSLQFASRTRRDNLSQIITYSETYDGSGGDSLCLRHYPVTQIVSLTINNVVVPLSPDGVQAGYIIEPGDYGIVRLVGFAFTAQLPQQPPSYFWRGYGNISVQYKAGYSGVPMDVEQAVIDWVAWIYRRRNRIGEVSKNIQGAVTAFSQRDLPPEVDAVISRYSDKVPV